MRYTQRAIRPIAERFWEKVDKNGPVSPKLGTQCWVWIGARKGRGENEYGIMQGGRREIGTVKAHRVSWELHYGPIPGRLLVLHDCNRKWCVNPDHLHLGDWTQNILEAWRDGLHWRTAEKRQAHRMNQNL